MVNNDKKIEEELFEQLADIEHQRWADWQKYVHSKGILDRVAKVFLLNKEWIDRWEKQINTPYSELTEREKESDREQVRRYWHLIVTAKSEVAKEILDDLDKLFLSRSEVNQQYTYLNKIYHVINLTGELEELRKKYLGEEK